MTVKARTMGKLGVASPRTPGSIRRSFMASGGVAEHRFATKFEKSLRETLRPLISLKTAKSRPFWAQGYQGVRKTRDFADEADSFRFRFVLPYFHFARNLRLSAPEGPLRPSKIWKTPHGPKRLFWPHNPLKRLKTAKEMFAKIWRKQAKICENLHKKLGGLARFE